MNAITILVAGLLFSTGVVRSVNDVNDPIRYIGTHGAYFIGISGSNFRMGTPIDAIRDPAQDMPQFAGKIDDCSSEIFKCKAIAYLKFVVPRRDIDLIKYQAGVDITLKRQANGGYHASAVCPSLAPIGCVSRSDGGRPAVTYQYDVNNEGAVIAISIQYWSDTNVKINCRELVLTSRYGLRL